MSAPTLTAPALPAAAAPRIDGLRIKHDATQCGYCTPGFVVATRAFLNEHPKATLEEIQKNAFDVFFARAVG